MTLAWAEVRKTAAPLAALAAEPPPTSPRRTGLAPRSPGRSALGRPGGFREA